jgi:hypothetical protein
MKNLILLFGLLYLQGAFSCTCNEVQTRIDSLSYSISENEVFVGKVIQHEKVVIKKGNKRRPPQSMNVYTFKVATNYSLSTQNHTVKIYTTTGNCGIQYEIGQTYLICSSNPKSKKVGRTTSICRRNVLLAKAEDEIALLNKLCEKQHITQ